MDRQWLIASWIALLFLYPGYDVFAEQNLCDLNDGRKNFTLFINESRGLEENQTIDLAEFPIVGDHHQEITLSTIQVAKNSLLSLGGKTLRLRQPLDRDANNVQYVSLNVTCKINSNQISKIIPIYVFINDINDNAPVFSKTLYQGNVSKMATIGTYVRTVKAKDIDADKNAQIKYSVIAGNVTGDLRNGKVSDGVEHFMMKSEDSGEIVLKKDLYKDYERGRKYFVTIIATDQAENPAERLTSTTTLTVTVNDDDDQDISFECKNCIRKSQNGACLDPKYYTTIAFGEKSGNLTLIPENIHAVDLDSLNSSIQYTFLNGTPDDYSDYFIIHPESGTVEQIKIIYTSYKVNKFVITVKAKEKGNRRWTTAQLYIDVKQAICSSASDDKYGYIDENSTAGTKILDKRGQPIVLTVSHNDSCQKNPKVSYTFEVLNNFFTVDSDGYVCVNKTILVRDSPNTRNYTFQIRASRKDGHGFDILPYQMTIFLNDNNATDIDKEQNSTIISSSEQGASESEIDRTTELIKTTSQIITYGHYNITDSEGQFTHGVFEFKNNVTEINKEQYSTTSYSTIVVSKQGDSKLELDRTTELIKTTVQVTAEDHVSDNKIQTITSSSASVQANGNNGDSFFNNIYLPIALLVLVLIIAVIVSIVVSYLRCKASKETKENKYQMPYNVTMYTKPCDYVEQLLYTDVNNEYNDRLDYAGYMILENVNNSGDIHSPVNTMTKTASVNRIGSKATSTDDRSKMAVTSKPVVYDYATVGEKEFKQSAAHDGMTTFQRKDVKFCTNSKQ